MLWIYQVLVNIWANLLEIIFWSQLSVNMFTDPNGTLIEAVKGWGNGDLFEVLFVPHFSLSRITVEEAEDDEEKRADGLQNKQHQLLWWYQWQYLIKIMIFFYFF